MNLKHYIIKKLGGVVREEPLRGIKMKGGQFIELYPKGMAEMAGKTINKFLDNQFIESNKPGLNLTADDLKKVFKDAIKKAKPNDQLPMINGVQLTQEDLNNWYKRKDEKDKEEN